LNSATLNPISNFGQAHAGTAIGHWRLPDPSGPGQMVGRLFSPQGVALLEVHAQVLPPATGAQVGQLHGIVSTLVGPNPGPIGELRGNWRLSTTDAGEFTAHIVRPAQGGNPPHLIGELRGNFIDPQTQPPTGKFHGHWLLLP
jgi:hypothetical protein